VQRRAFCRGSLLLLADRLSFASGLSVPEVLVQPKEYTGPLRNPLKGLRAGSIDTTAKLPYASLAKCYIRWNEIEKSASDGVERIREFCDQHWAKMAAINTKVIPRVYLDWPPDGHFWPSDLPRGDYTSENFTRRMVGLIEKLGQAWDDDPRVAYVETGLIGLWGEQHDPAPTAEQQKAMGDAFTASFHNKLLMNRYPGHFTDYQFGIYWDSFGHKEEAPLHISLLKSPRLASRWKIAPMGGETAFDWGTPLGKNPTDALVRNTDTIVDLIRDLHWNHLGWLSEYDQHNPVAVANAARVQESLGYRFVLDEVRYPARVDPGAAFRVSMLVRNTGSSPFYYPWPVELSLLDPDTKAARWRSQFAGFDLRSILPGAGATQICGEFACPSELHRGDYLLAIAISDPAGNKPSARFATTNYFRGGRHPVGWISAGVPATQRPLPAFDNPAQDQTINYEA
jgi:Domain of unknown function (DUF4832)